MSLAITPPPFGLGISPDLFTYTIYNGGEKLKGASPGFISFHPRDGCLNLMPNVYTRTGGVLDETLNGHTFYFWGNHKVIQYKDKFFDPTYGCQYAEAKDMAAMTIADLIILGKKEEFDSQAFDRVSANDTEGKCWVKAITPAKRPYYFGARAPLDCAAGVLWNGPYTKSEFETIETTKSK